MSGAATFISGGRHFNGLPVVAAGTRPIMHSRARPRRPQPVNRAWQLLEGLPEFLRRQSALQLNETRPSWPALPTALPTES
jgi:hypothetical protein